MRHSVEGFRFSAVATQIKEGDRLDLALLAAESDVPVAAVFTRNRIKGAPVLISQERAKAGLARALIVHSGNANSCTGRAGLLAAEQVTHAVAESLQADERRVLIAGTGIVGVPLPIGRILDALPDLLGGAHLHGFDDFAAAILTTDRGTKVAHAEVAVGRTHVHLLGCAKGTTMVAPNLATTLAFVVTDAVVDLRWLRQALREEIDATFNDISVDGDSSTNDSAFLLASGRAGNRPIDGGATGRAFRAALRDVLEELAMQVVADGEGATRTVSIEVVGAGDARLARQIARRVASSSLVKATIFGADPNWGRIMAAIGCAGVDVNPERIDIEIGNVLLVRGGVANDDDEAEARAHSIMAGDAYPIRIHLHNGRATARHVTCDLTHRYLTVNAEYRT